MSNAVKIRKSNRVLYVEPGRLDSFLSQGYDQIDEEGNVVNRATGGRTVSLPEYNKVLDENEILKAKIVELEKETKKEPKK